MNTYKVAILNGDDCEFIDPRFGNVVEGTNGVFGVSVSYDEIDKFKVDHIPTGRAFEYGSVEPLVYVTRGSIKFKCRFDTREEAERFARMLWAGMTPEQRTAYSGDDPVAMQRHYPREVLVYFAEKGAA